MMKGNSNYFPILIFAVLVFGILFGFWLKSANQYTILGGNNPQNKINKVIDFVSDEYVDKVNLDSITNHAIDNILSHLDPHSVYILPKDQVRIAQSMKGDFVGIGVNFYVFKDSLAVVKTIENGPSEKAGIKAGDRILFADATKLFGKKIVTDSIISKLKGKIGSQVALTIYRKSERKIFKVRIKRVLIPIKSVDIALLLNSKTGYIKINRFSETTFDEFHKGLISLKSKGINTLIIDLRNNGGGYMDQAIAIADEFLQDKQLIVFTKNKKGTIEKSFATTNGSFEKGRVFVLINENSASASEILAGAIQDNDRGIIVGRRSFGKGLVQREMDFNDGSAVRLTIARYYTPTGRSIQKPYINGNVEYERESDSRFANGELYFKDSIKSIKKLQYKTPKGRIVFGGGGIVPDVFVATELVLSDKNSAYILDSGLLSQFVFEQLDRNRNRCQGVSFENCLAKINRTDVYFNLLQKHLFTIGLKLNLEKNKVVVKKYLLAEFAGQLFNEDKYYEVLLKDDPMINAILK